MANDLAKKSLQSIFTIFLLSIAAFGQQSYYGNVDSRNSASGKTETAAATKRNVKIAKQYFKEIWNKGNVNLLDRFVAENYTIERIGDYLNLETFALADKQNFVADFRRAFPDAKFKITELRADADSVLVRVIVTGTHKNEFQGVAPTGKRIRVDQMQLKRFDNGKIVFHTQILDDQQLVAQLLD